MDEYVERGKAINAVFEAFADGRSAYIALESIPAADVRPVVRGKWIYNDSEQLEDVFVDTMRCSCCGECADKEIHIFQYCIELEYRYCPNCGAMMEEN